MKKQTTETFEDMLRAIDDLTKERDRWKWVATHDVARVNNYLGGIVPRNANKVKTLQDNFIG